MKKIYITLVSLASIPVSVNAQDYSTATFSGNNIEAAVNNGGVFFNDEINQSPAYEYPKGSGNHLVYANSRSEEHTSELQSRPHLVCRLLLEKKKKNN